MTLTIKRFINQDILTGSITDSQSLNRYSYVEGNPVSFLDPFGLSKLHNTIASIRGAYNIIHKALADPFYVVNDAIRGAVHVWKNIDDHTKLNILGTLPVIGYVFDIANAISYFKDGNVEQGIESLIFALPTLNIAGGAGTIAKLFTSSQKTADVVGNALQLIGSATAAFTATAKVFNGIADMFNTYYRGGTEKDERFYAEVGEVLAYALMASVFGTMAMKDARAYFNATELIDELQIFEKGRVVNDEEIEWIKEGDLDINIDDSNIPEWKGSGPAPGVLGINDKSLSNVAIKNYYPKEGIEFVFDAQTNTFVVGKPKYTHGYSSPHQKLADTIGADQRANLSSSSIHIRFQRMENRRRY